jgi:hypothetical protein
MLQQDVLGFQVTVYYMQLAQISQRLQQLACKALDNNQTDALNFQL